MPHHDLVIIGTGSGNSLLTPELDGLDVAIVEAGTFGGTCINVGCIPTKMFVLPADRVAEAADAHRLGVTFSGPTVDWPGTRDRVFGRVDAISAGGLAYREGQDRVTVYPAHARFVGVRDGCRSPPVRSSPPTASSSPRAPGPTASTSTGLREPDPDRALHTSDTVMRLDTLPPRMAVVGGGYVACELAHVFSSLGVTVTQVQRGPALLSHHEVEVAQRYTEVARRHIDLRLSTTPTSAEHIGDVWRIEVEGPGGPGHVEAEVVLLAVGRRPNTDRLDPAGRRARRPRRRPARRRCRAAHDRRRGLGPRRHLLRAPAQARGEPRGPARRPQPRGGPGSRRRGPAAQRRPARAARRLRPPPGRRLRADRGRARGRRHPPRHRDAGVRRRRPTAGRSRTPPASSRSTPTSPAASWPPTLSARTRRRSSSR